MIIYVIDIGTSSMRGILFDQNATLFMKEQVSHTPSYFPNGYVEQDPLILKKELIFLCSSLADYCKAHNITPDAIVVTSQRSSVIPLKDNKPLMPAIMWQDKRTLCYKETLKHFDSTVFSKSGSTINPVFSACKMTWIHENLPDIYRECDMLAVIPEYLIYIMTGNRVLDYTYGSRSQLMNIRTNTWDKELLDIFKVDREKLGDLVPPASICGRMTKAFAKLCNLKEGIPVITAGGDQQCAALGLGVFQDGDFEITTGTGAFILACCETIPRDIKDDVIFSASAIPNQYLLESNILTCCSAFNWFKSTFYPESTPNNFDSINSDLETCMQTPILALPYFQGRATPDWNSNSLATFHNISLSSTRGDFAHALLEGICYEMNCNLKTLQKYLKSIHHIKLCGGLTNCTIFPQLEADILQLPISVYENEEATALGAFIQASLTLGFTNNYTDAFAITRKDDSIKNYIPNKTTSDFYLQKQKDFESLYHKLYPSDKKIS